MKWNFFHKLLELFWVNSKIAPMPPIIAVVTKRSSEAPSACSVGTLNKPIRKIKDPSLIPRPAMLNGIRREIDSNEKIHKYWINGRWILIDSPISQKEIVIKN